MDKLKVAKKVIKENIKYGYCGLFNTRNDCGDAMTTLYEEDGLTIDICYFYSYFEVFGLTDAEFQSLDVYYHKIGGV